jgi:UDP-N-acetylglucosamine--N-acetylmuramyl-(pentapeptide) pyrophosphoryl-undecaprenol N-acetylglucosamine transferase
VGPDDRLLLSFGGSQAVLRLTSALEAALEELLVDWQVLHVAGEAGLSDARATQARLPESLRGRYHPVGFLTDEMADALVAADLVLGRAGSSTCAEVTAAGVASILVPYPHAGGHQRANAAWLGDQGAAVVVPDAELDGPRLLAEARRLRDDAGRGRMAAAARGLGRPEAAAAIADELLALADGRPLPQGAGEAP